MIPEAHLGATARATGSTDFLVWAPHADRVEVVLDPDGDARAVAMGAQGRGYHHTAGVDCGPGTRYRFRLHPATGDAASVVERADPASRWQPDGVHGPSAVAATDFAWSDGGWAGRALDEYVIYELHIGAFTRQGTFDAAVERLDDLVDLGITAVEIMPVAQFPGARNWGYDGVFPYAVQDSYGGPDGLRRFVDACHARGLAVVLDVVYNHFGPEGSRVDDFGPYRTDRYQTPWGDALNFDGPGSDGVRRFVVENAVRWITEFHVDALRLDAADTIVDTSAHHVLADIAAGVHDAAAVVGRRALVIAETDLNDPRILRPPESGGLDLDAQWSDDFHHALHAVLTGERDGYYQDFGTNAELATAMTDRYVYTGRYSRFHDRTRGAPARDVPHRRFVVFAQNHDQIGNRRLGKRLHALAGYERAKLAAAAVLLSPYTPLLFMGEEYADPAPFRYFTDHSDPGLVEAVRQGRRDEFADFGWEGRAPDPQDPATFEGCRLDWELRDTGRHGALRELHAELLRLRRDLPALAPGGQVTARVRGPLVDVRRRSDDADAALLLNTGDEPATVQVPLRPGTWQVHLDTAATRWHGPGGGMDQPLTSEGEGKVTVQSDAALLLVRDAPP